MKDFYIIGYAGDSLVDRSTMEMDL